MQDKSIIKYVEPFIGGGAMYFHLKNNYHIRESYISDNNSDLILTYHIIKNCSKQLIEILKEMETQHTHKAEEKRKKNYYTIRDAYNQQDVDYQELINYFDFSNDIVSSDHTKLPLEWIERAGYFIFLNKTCYNGLYRLNSNGKFNVPFGRYKNPLICDEVNLLEVQNILKNAVIFQGDFSESQNYINEESFVYLDPPYRPLNSTSNFTSYSTGRFNDSSQKKLAEFFKEIDRRGARVMLSNSDPQNHDENDNFFDDLYGGYEIERVAAKRNINRDAKKRGVINELIIRNYP
jgi:DNA adenine methylase